MTDRALLELAARAGNVEIAFNNYKGEPFVRTNQNLPESCFVRPWSPRTDDGDAFRLALAAGISVLIDDDEDARCVTARYTLPGRFSPNSRLEDFRDHGDDKGAAARAAIWLAAIDIGAYIQFLATELGKQSGETG